MFLTKKAIPRRTFLRGAGVTLALPLLESMVPAATALAETPATGAKPRFVGVFYPHGMAPGYWEPKKEGPLPEKLPFIMESLEKVKDQTVAISGLWSKSAEPPEGTTGSDHWVAAAFLTAIKPRKTAGSDASVGSNTIDQIIADKIGGENLLPSLQLAVEDPNSSSSNCGEGYSCSYTNSISWRSGRDDRGKEVQGVTPLPMELDPQVVFERLFGSGATSEARAARVRQGRSILDSLVTELQSLKKNLGKGDQNTLNNYTEEVREIERRLQLAQKASNSVPALDEPSGVPEQFDDHIKLHWDLVALAFQADITRVVTLLGARDLTGKTYPFPKTDPLFPEGGVSVSFHGGSHHQDDPTQIKSYSKLNRYHLYTTAYLANKLKATPDGDGTLLDHSLILHGTNMGNSNQHQHFDVPHFLIGGMNGKLKGGRHIHFDRKTVTTGNLLLSILDMYDVRQDRQGDSTGRLTNL